MSPANQFLVSQQGDRVVILRMRNALSHEEAMNLAAWLTAMTDPEEVAKLVEAIQRGGTQ